jgi:hypothetical protein
VAFAHDHPAPQLRDRELIGAVAAEPVPDSGVQPGVLAHVQQPAIAGQRVGGGRVHTGEEHDIADLGIELVSQDQVMQGQSRLAIINGRRAAGDPGRAIGGGVGMGRHLGFRQRKLRCTHVSAEGQLSGHADGRAPPQIGQREIVHAIAAIRGAEHEEEYGVTADRQPAAIAGQPAAGDHAARVAADFRGGLGIGPRDLPAGNRVRTLDADHEIECQERLLVVNQGAQARGASLRQSPPRCDQQHEEGKTD